MIEVQSTHQELNLYKIKICNLTLIKASKEKDTHPLCNYRLGKDHFYISQKVCADITFASPISQNPNPLNHSQPQQSSHQIS